MLPEMFCSAKDCACNPPTEVFSASKIPIPLLHVRFSRAEAHAPPKVVETIASVVPNGKITSDQTLRQTTGVRGPALNCRAGQELPADRQSFRANWLPIPPHGGTGTTDIRLPLAG